MEKLILILTFITIIFGCTSPEKEDPDQSVFSEEESGTRDLFTDTWVATDAVGRTMPGIDSTGPLKKDKQRVVGIFYITWHTRDKHRPGESYDADVTKILQKAPGARMDAEHELWKDYSYHWGEPEMGYFLSQDEWVIRKDISMLADAGVDVLVMDVTNAARYWDEWEVLFSTLQEMKAGGNRVPQFLFWAFNGPVITVVQDLYDKIYKEKRFSDLWFYWNGKPLLLYNATPFLDANPGGMKHPNPHYDPEALTNKNHLHYGNPDYTEEFYQDYTAEVKEFFTLRSMWWGYYEWGGERFVGTENNWSFGYNLADQKVKSLHPDSLISTHRGRQEEAAVTAAQHPVNMGDGTRGVGKSWSRASGQPALDEYDMPLPTYVPWLNKTVDNPTAYGIYFQERWDEAIAADPEFLYINDWNEWTAGKYYPQKDGSIAMTPDQHDMTWLGRVNPFIFVDQYNAEFNRCIHPMKGGYTDNYYMQMSQNIRRYKGVRPIPETKGIRKMKIDGKFTDWKKVEVEYRDTKGDVFHRDHPGYGGLHYTDTTGRNDIITGKVAVTRKEVCFYVETDQPLTDHQEQNWMLLLIDADRDVTSGWYGYDYLVNKRMMDQNQTILLKYNQEKNTWEEKQVVEFSYAYNKMELAIPREVIGFTGSSFSFDFKWSDNPSELKDPISLCLHGDTAPNRRFNYRCIWKQ
ncbi:MAG: hypothetical protein ABFS28_16550 [Bacteroidota bacterium]